MRLRTVTLVTVAAGVAGATVWWRRRRGAAARPRIQLGLGDGSTVAADPGDASGGEITAAAAALRSALGADI